MRRAIIIVILLGITAGIVWWLRGWNATAVRHVDPWRIVPPTAAAIIHVPEPLNTWDRFKSTSQLWNAWSDYPACHALDSIMGALRGGVDGGELVAALTVAEGGFNLTLAWAFDDPRMLSGVEKVLPGIGQGRKVIAATTALPAMECALKDGLLLLGTSTTELNDALHRLDGPAPALDSSFAAARGSLGESGDAHVLLHTGRARRMLNTWLAPEALAPIGTLNGWVALDVRARPEATLLSGMFYPEEVPASLLAGMGQGSGPANMGRVLPPGITTQWQTYITDAASYNAGAVKEPSDLFSTYGSWAYGPVGVATAGDDRSWAVVTTDDPPRAVEALEQRSGGGLDTLSYRSIRMSRTVDTLALAAVWGAPFRRFVHPWWCLLGDRVVFSEQVNSLREAIDAWTDGSSFLQDTRSGALFHRYASDATFTWWCDVEAGINSLRTNMRPAGTAALDAHKGGWSRTGAVLLQLIPDTQGSYQLTACIGGASGMAASGAAGAALASTGVGGWSVSVGAPIIAGPFLLTDHLSRTKQILVQDRKNRIHLITCTGKVLWQRELDGPLMGDAHQVDRYKNGKLQMLLNTADRVYLIDRNGENVTGFPITLPEKASGPANVFDYDGNKEYRVLVPTVKARVLNFDITGRPPEGWTAPTTPAVCSLPVEHVRTRGKDHLLLVDEEGGITVLDRRAAPRYTPKLRVRDAARVIGLDPGLEIGETRVVWEDVERNRLRGRLDGPVDTLTLDVDSVILHLPRPYPWAGTTNEAMPHGLVYDIDLDGVKERVTATADGHVITEKLP